MAHRVGGGQGRYAGPFAHESDRLGVVVVVEHAGRGLRETDDFHFGGAEQLGLVFDVRVQAGREGRVAAFAKPGHVELQGIGKQLVEFDLDGRVGRGNQ